MIAEIQPARLRVSVCPNCSARYVEKQRRGGWHFRRPEAPIPGEAAERYNAPQVQALPGAIDVELWRRKWRMRDFDEPNDAWVAPGARAQCYPGTTCGPVTWSRLKASWRADERGGNCAICGERLVLYASSRALLRGSASRACLICRQGEIEWHSPRQPLIPVGYHRRKGSDGGVVDLPKSLDGPDSQ